MPDLNIRNVDQSLLRAVNVESAKADMTQRDWVIKVLTNAVGWEQLADRAEKTENLRAANFVNSGTHDPENCKVYGCLMCKALKEA